MMLCLKNDSATWLGTKESCLTSGHDRLSLLLINSREDIRKIC